MIFRIRKTTHYVTINNSVLRNERLSWCARGIMAYLLSLPDTENVTIESLSERAKEGRRRVQSALKELEAEGYFQRHRHKDDKGKWVWQIDVFEQPCTETHTAGNGQMETRLTETALIKDIKTKKEVITPLPPFCGPPFTEALNEFLGFHDEIKKPYTVTGLKRLFRDLKEWGESAATVALRTSVRNRWQGVFAPNGNGASHPNAYAPDKMVL